MRWIHRWGLHGLPGGGGVGFYLCDKNDLNNRISALDLRLARGVKTTFGRVSALESQLLSLQSKLDALLVEKACEQLDLAQLPTQGASPIQALLRNWRSDTDLVFADYVKATTQAMLNTMAPKGTASPLAPMVAWIDCNGSALMGVPRVVSGCAVRDSAGRLLNTLDRLANLPADSLAAGIGLPTSTELKQLQAQILGSVTSRVEKWVTGGLKWLAVAPPRPWLSDAVTRYAPKTFTDPSTGLPRYPRDNAQGFRSKAGFALWSDGADEAGRWRRALFAGLFMGPLSPGVENPGEIGLDGILAEGRDGPYPYRPCNANPFPASWRLEDGSASPMWSLLPCRGRLRASRFTERSPCRLVMRQGR